MAAMADLKSLRSLNVICQFDAVTDNDLVQLKNIPSLQFLNLYYCTKVTDAGLAHLKALPALQELKLWVPRATDVGLAHLKELHTLRRLEIIGNGNGNSLTDAGLAQLKGLTALERLELHDTLITDAGAADFQKALPMCKLIRDQPTDP